MSIECNCCNTFECERRNHIRETQESVDRELDPEALRRFRVGMQSSAGDISRHLWMAVGEYCFKLDEAYKG